MKKVAAMPIYGKTLKIFSGTKWPITLKLDMQHYGLGSTKFVQMMTCGWTWSEEVCVVLGLFSSDTDLKLTTLY